MSGRSSKNKIQTRSFPQRGLYNVYVHHFTVLSAPLCLLLCLIFIPILGETTLLTTSHHLKKKADE